MNGKILIGIFSVLAAIAAFSLTHASEFGVRNITLKGKAQVSDQIVCVSDLVEESWFQTRCRLEKEKCCRLNLEGKLSKVFTKAQIQREASNIDLGGFKAALIGSDQVLAEQVSRALREDEIEDKLEKAIHQKFGSNDIDPTIRSLKFQSPIYVMLKEESDWDFVLPEQLNSAETAVRIISTKNQTLGWVRAAFSVLEPVYVAKKTIQPGDSIRVDDFELKVGDALVLQTGGRAIFRKGEFPQGYRARQAILAGSVLSSSVIDRLPVVRLGDTVTLILRSDNLRISTKGVVQGAASVGDMVTVQLPRYNRTFRGKLTEGRKVEVWL
ncbi:MAG: flagellar basal body P-ring formation chaperone FlgA [Bacteriovoracia bacterium]